MRCWTRETNDLTELLPRNTRASSMFVKWKYSPTFCIALFSFFSTCRMCFISLWEHKWALEHLNHQEVNFLSQAFTSDCVHVEDFWLFPETFVDEGEQTPLHFGYVNSCLCYNSTYLLLVPVSDATLPVNLQSGIIISYIMRYQSQHPEKNCWPSNGHCTLHFYNKAALYMCKYLPAEVWAPFCTSVCALEKLRSVVIMWWDLSVS